MSDFDSIETNNGSDNIADTLEFSIKKAADRNRDRSDVDLGADLGTHHQSNRLEEQLSQERTRGAALKRKHQEAIDLHVLRNKYLKKIYNLMVGWLVFVALILLVDAIALKKSDHWWNLSWIVREFDISDSVMISLLSSTTAAVIGVFVIVAKWLFPKNME